MLQEKTVDNSIIDGGKKAFYSTIQSSLKEGKYGVYLNYIDHSIENWEELYYGKNYDKLQQIKSTYDPSNIFKRNYVAIEKKATEQVP